MIQKDIPDVAAKHELTFAGYKGEMEDPSIQSVGMTLERGDVWRATSNDDWMQLAASRDGKYGTSVRNSGSLFIKLAPNTSGEQRIGTITITTSHWISVKTETITVTQGIDEEK